MKTDNRTFSLSDAYHIHFAVEPETEISTTVLVEDGKTYTKEGLIDIAIRLIAKAGFAVQPSEFSHAEYGTTLLFKNHKREMEKHGLF